MTQNEIEIIGVMCITIVSYFTVCYYKRQQVMTDNGHIEFERVIG